MKPIITMLPGPREMGGKVAKTLLATLLAVSLSPSAPAQETPPPFGPWLEDLKVEARQIGVGEETLQRVLGGIKPIPRVIELDRRQPEFMLTFWGYLKRSISDKRINTARTLMAKHRGLLEKVSARYGVQPRFLVSFWGLESNFGEYTGTFPVAGALVTLAHDRRRARFFRAQLLAVLKLMDRGDIAANAKGSWAGAMGNHQFIPTTYRDFAVDFDGDGKRDLWNSLPDIFASAANYLSRSGWDSKRTWGREVRLPKGFDFELAGLTERRSLADWQKIGVRRADGRDLPRVDIEGSIVLPAGSQGPAFMVYKNYRTILVWNRSILYALAVGHLADRIAGGGGLLAKPREGDAPMSRRDIVTLQKVLAERGFDAGGADGIVGPATRQAIKAYQKSVDLPPDGYPSMGLLERLRGTGG